MARRPTRDCRPQKPSLSDPENQNNKIVQNKNRFASLMPPASAAKPWLSNVRCLSKAMSCHHFDENLDKFADTWNDELPDKKYGGTFGANESVCAKIALKRIEIWCSPIISET